MATRAIHVNLHFEYAHARGPQVARQPAMRALNARWASALRLIPGFEQALVLPELSAPWPALDALCVWGVTAEVEAAFAREGRACVSARSAREVTDRRFAWALEQALGAALPGAACVDSLDALGEAVARMQGPWVAKHPLGVSGRERARGAAGALDDQARAWCARQLSAGWPLIVEPWLEQAREHSVHLRYEADGLSCLGTCWILADATGTPRGHVVHPDAPPAPSPALMRLLGQALARSGYEGPLSLDVMTGLLAGQEVSRPITEINARYTFGRLALELGRYAPQGWALGWWHPPARVSAPRTRGALHPQVQAPGWYRLPEGVDPAGASGTAVYVAPPERFGAPRAWTPPAA